MEKEVIQQWDLNKNDLKKYFKSLSHKDLTRLEYKDLVVSTFKYAIKYLDRILDTDEITEIDNGDYQGTKIYLIPNGRYQPSIKDYYITSVDYGSCSGCDTLLNYQEECYTESDKGVLINNYMTMCLHIVQETKSMKSLEYNG